MSALQTIVTQKDVVTTTSHHKRDISERLRRLHSTLTPMLSLVKGSSFDSFGKEAYTGEGMFKKESCSRVDPEWFTYTPIDIVYAATGGSSSTAVVADTTYFQVDDTVFNQNTNEVGIVTALTNSTTLAITGMGGDWSCTAGDYVVLMASAYEEGTARYSNITKENTRCQTRLQTYREGLTWSTVSKTVDSYLSESQNDQYKANTMYHALSKLESSFLFSKEGVSSGTTSVTIGGTAYTIQTMRGLVNYAGSAIDMGGALTWDSWNTNLYLKMPQTLIPSETMYAVMGTKISSEMNMWVQDSHLMTSENKGQTKFGTSVKTYLMGGNLKIEPMVHGLFNTGIYKDSILFFQSSDIAYLFLKGLDLQIRKNAQNPAMMGQTDIIEGLVGLKSYSNGANIKLVKNCLSAAA